jgi:hypothetical protein
MPPEIHYQCSECGWEAASQPETRSLLTVKKVMFLEMGVGGRTLKSRIIGRLCPKCVETDPDYIKEPFDRPYVVKQREALK